LSSHSDETTSTVPFKLERVLREETATELSPSDLDRVLEFIQRLRGFDQNEEKITSIKVGEVGLSLPDPKTAKKLIEDAGGVDEVDYIALIIPHRLSIDADFRKKILKIRATSKAECYDLLTLWQSLGSPPSMGAPST